MKTSIASIPCVVLSLLAALPITQSTPPIELELAGVSKIWDQAPHNAFPDMVWFQDYWYVGLREANSHAVSGDGKVRVIRSEDGVAWDSVALLDYGPEYASNVDSLDRRFYMNLGSDANGDPIVALAGGPNITLSGLGDGYHLYELKYDPTAGSAGLFVDGIERLSDYAGIGNIGLARVMWGANQSDSTGTANYNYVLFRNSFIETIPGDANHDGAVDDVDASILASHWLRHGGVTWEDGDFNGDATVNDADAAVLAAHWGAGGAESAPQVPEPTTPTLLLGIGLLLGWRQLRRST